MKPGSLILAALVALGLSTPLRAVEPGEMLADPVLEARARAIGHHLRCLVCQNQSIDDSDADLARDLRRLLRQRLLAGDSDQQARQFIVDRYGDYVLLKPPFKSSTLLLWFGPALLLGAGSAGLVRFYRRRGAVQAPLDLEERRRLSALLGEEEIS